MIKTHKFKLLSVINVPALGMGVFSRNYQTLDKLQSGDRIALPKDSCQSGLCLAPGADLGLITLNPERDERTLFISDIVGNAYQAEFITVEAQELADQPDDCALAFVPGNCAVTAGFAFSQALVGAEDCRGYEQCHCCADGCQVSSK